jgi:NAD(P)-dependent dehydrogenase (short-subunit alcohol dehydrogenase family)
MSDAERTAVVMGASSGIGAASARALARTGHHVRVMARRADQLEELAAEIGGSHAVVDVTVASEIEEALARAGEELERIDVGVYAAGVLDVAAVDGHPVELWQRTIDVNLTGAFLFARGVVPHMGAGSRIVFLSSVSGSKGQPQLSAYAASKGGLNRLAESLSAELEGRGIGVHNVQPGPVATPLLDRPGTSGYQLEADQVANVIEWLISLPDDVVLRDVVLRATMKGPFARDRHQGVVSG